MQTGGDGFGWRVTAEHMTFQDPGVFISCYIRKIPERVGGRQREHQVNDILRRKKKAKQDENETDLETNET